MAADAAIGKGEFVIGSEPAYGGRCPPEWQALWSAQSAGARDSDTADQERGTALSGDVMADLSHFGLIGVDGPEAAKFLGSLFTGEIRAVSPHQAQFTSWCDGKGRMLATFWLFLRDDTYYLLLPIELLPSIMTRLRQFLLRTKASISDASARLARLGLSGPGVAAALTDMAGAEHPPARGATWVAGDCTVVAIDSVPRPRWLAIGPPDALGALSTRLRPAVVPVAADTWFLLDILAGTPWLLPATSGEFIPQMLDLEALGGLSFTKGCYPGQEVVARLQYRGQLKRRLFSAQVAGDDLPAPGVKLYGPGTTESVGMVIASAALGGGRAALLAVAVIEQQQSGDVRLGDPQGPKLVFETAGGDPAEEL